MGEKEEEVEEGDARERGCSGARRRGAGGVVAYGTPAHGAVRHDADGSTDDGRNCRPDDADSCACSVFGYASDADGRTHSFSDADGGWVRNPNAVVDHVMMRTRGRFARRATRSAIGVSGTRGVFGDGIKSCGQGSPLVCKLAGKVHRMADRLT